MRERSARASFRCIGRRRSLPRRRRKFECRSSFVHFELAGCDVQARLISRSCGSFRPIRPAHRRPRHRTGHDGPPLRLPYASTSASPAFADFLLSLNGASLAARRRAAGSGRRPFSAVFLGPEPRVPGGVLAGVVRVEVNEAPLDQPVTDLKDVAPAASARFGDSRAPRTVLMLAVARALDDQQITAGEDPVEMRVVVSDRLERPAHIAEHLADLHLASREPPLREVDLRVFGEEVEDTATGRGDAAVVERLQVLKGDRLALLIGHNVARQRHEPASPLFRTELLQHVIGRKRMSSAQVVASPLDGVGVALDVAGSGTGYRPGNLSGSGPVRSFLFSSVMSSTSVAGSSKSKMSMFSLILSGVTDLGNTMSPRWMCQRSTT